MTEASPDNPGKPPITDPQTLMLREYLAQRDAPCPDCGYNLRGLETLQCPECGETLELNLQASSPLAGRRNLILLVFLWLLTVSSLQSYFNGQAMLASASNPFIRIQSILNTVMGSGSITINPNAFNFPGTTTSTTSTTIITGTGTPGSSINSIPLSRFSIPPQLSGRVFGPAGSKYNWQLISWQQWTRGGLWVALLILALVGLVMLWRCRRGKPITHQGSKAISVLAWSGFGGYIFLHLITSILGIF